MRVYLLASLVCATLLVSAAEVHAQGDVPSVELFVGESTMWGTAATMDWVCTRGINCTIATDRDRRVSYSSGGWNSSIVGNINRYAGIEMDVGCCQRPGSLNTRQSTFTLGPHFTYRAIGRVHPFTHSLIGLVNGRQFAIGYHTSWRPGFAFVLGGGIDVRVMDALWIRAVQLDYFHESFRDDVQRNGRLSLGVVLRFGSLAKHK